MIVGELTVQGAANHSTYLKKIAETLGCTVADLVDGGRSLQHAGQVELLRLWNLLPDDKVRLRLLEIARALAEPANASEDQDGARP